MENDKKNSLPIKSWSLDDRPREKMLSKGVAALSNAELLAILINNGSKDRSALELAKEIMLLGKNNLDELGKLSIKDLQKIKGIGAAKAITITAALEIGRRRESEGIHQKTVVTNSRDIAQFLRASLKDLAHEVFVAIYLNQGNRILSYKIISNGGLSGTVADPRIILKTALEEGATGIVLCHNHPSGNLRPSMADETLTQKIKQGAALIDIRIMDHIIVSNEGYYSFADEGIL
ncbi:MAG: DNA repair protein RadC [Chitinophagaceae bacterium]|nr:MAG: DNA repair protein RadC [Chitinophagaceae bacterium]